LELLWIPERVQDTRGVDANRACRTLKVDERVRPVIHRPIKGVFEIRWVDQIAATRRAHQERVEVAAGLRCLEFDVEHVGLVRALPVRNARLLLCETRDQSRRERRGIEHSTTKHHGHIGALILQRQQRRRKGTAPAALREPC
jgi:hypothetical protein